MKKQRIGTRVRKSMLILFVGVGLSICSFPEQLDVSGSGRCYAIEKESADLYEDSVERMINRTNEERTLYGLEPLAKDEMLMEAAILRATELYQCFAHVRPDGTPFYTVFNQIGTGGARRGENLARGKVGIHERVFDAWMDSAGHKANIINGQFTRIGTGYVEIQGVGYWCQLFAD